MASEDNLSRSSRALGRGFEDISHLFLPTAPASQAPEPIEGPAGQPPGGRPSSRAGVAVLRPCAGPALEQVIATLVECQDALETGVRMLAAGISCSPYGEIDVLAVDRANQLIIIDVATTHGDRLLFRGIGQVDWAVHNMANLRRMFPTVAIEASLQPRLVLVAPAFSRGLEGILRQLRGPRVACFIYHPVAISGRTGLLIEPLLSERPSRDDTDSPI